MCDCRAKYDKQYYKKNSERIKAKSIKYRNDNREQISAKAKQRIVCACGCNIAKSSKARHMRTKRHAKLMAALHKE